MPHSAASGPWSVYQAWWARKKLPDAEVHDAHGCGGSAVPGSVGTDAAGWGVGGGHSLNAFRGLVTTRSWAVSRASSSSSRWSATSLARNPASIRR